MKMIIDGKKYDTETAKLVGERDWIDMSVNYRQSEYFYRKKTGEFFRYDDKRTTWGNINNYTKIVPLSEEEAKHALESILDTEDYEEIFGNVAE